MLRKTNFMQSIEKILTWDVLVAYVLNPLRNWNQSEAGTITNSEDLDEMPHDQGLHCLLWQIRSSEKEIQYILKINLNNLV